MACVFRCVHELGSQLSRYDVTQRSRHGTIVIGISEALCTNVWGLGTVKRPYLPILHFFNVKLPSVTQRSVSQENAFKKSKNPSPFLRKTIGSNNDFTLIQNNFRVLR